MDVITNVAQETPILFPMSDVDIVRAWRVPRYRRSLSAEQMQMLPGNPAGPTDLTGDELFPDQEEVITTAIDCTLFTFNNWIRCGCPK